MKKQDEEGEENDNENENEEDKDEEDEENEGETKEVKKNNKKMQITDDEEENQDTQSSITSSSGSTMRSFYSLRAAIDEKFVPLSIRNMGCSAIIVFILILAISSISILINLYSCVLCNAGYPLWKTKQ